MFSSDCWFLFPDIMMSSKLIRNIFTVPKLLRVAQLSCSHCLETEVSGSVMLYSQCLGLR